MPVRYYQDDNHYPYVLLSIVERVKLYFAEVLYPNETQVNGLKKIILANFDDDVAAIRRSIDTFKNSNGTFPCTFYSISDDEPVEYRSNLQKSGNFYSTLLNTYIRFIPMRLSIPMVTFFTTPFDFWRGMTIFAEDEADLSRLDVPVTINGVLTYFTIDLEYTTERGALAFDIEQAFQVGRLYPVIHTVDVKGAYITLNTERSGSEGTSTGGGISNNKIVYHVDDIILKLNALSNSENLDQNINIDSTTIPDIPEVTSSYPLNNASGVPRSSDITLSFNVGMNEDSVYNNIDIVPYMDKDMSFDFSGRVLTIAPRDLLTASTEYSILINDEAKSGSGIYLASDYELIFTTGLN